MTVKYNRKNGDNKMQEMQATDNKQEHDIKGEKRCGKVRSEGGQLQK